MTITVQDVLNASTKAELTNWWLDVTEKFNRGEGDQLIGAMRVRRHPHTILGFLSKEQAWEAIQKSKENSSLLITHGLTMCDDKQAFFLTDDSLFGMNQSGHPPLEMFKGRCTFSLPLGTRAQTFTNIDQFIDTYAKSSSTLQPLRYISSLEELVDYINENYRKS